MSKAKGCLSVCLFICYDWSLLLQGVQRACDCSEPRRRGGHRGGGRKDTGQDTQDACRHPLRLEMSY